MREKQMVRKYWTYSRHATSYNKKHKPTNLIPHPSLLEVQGMGISDTFWEAAGLTHPDEDWAADPLTREGITAFRMERSCGEEMRRLAREVRQLIRWAVNYQQRIDSLQNESSGGYITLYLFCSIPDFILLPQCFLAQELDGISSSSLKSLHSGLSKQACQLWMSWRAGVRSALEETAPFLILEDGFDNALLSQWDRVEAAISAEWTRMVGSQITVVDLDEDPVIDDHEDDL